MMQLSMDVENDQQEFPSRIGQWERFKILPKDRILEIESFFLENHFSLQVRDFLALWIESQPWSSIIDDEDTAKFYLNTMIQEIGKCAQRQQFCIECLLNDHAKKIQEHYGKDPLKFKYFMENMLIRELLYLTQFEEKVGNDVGGQSIKTNDWTHHLEQLENESKEIQKNIEELKLRMVEYDAGNIEPYTKKFQISKGKDLNTIKAEEIYGILQEKLDHLISMYGHLKVIMNDILDNNLKNWICNQRLYENSTGKDDLGEINKWCSLIASMILASQQQIKVISELQQSRNDQLNDSFTDLYIQLLKRTFIISQQPPQIMQINNLMLASVRLLCDGAIDSNPPTVTAELISQTGENKGKLANNTCTMDSVQNQYTATFENMKLINVKRTREKGVSVTEEKFLLKFSMKIHVGKELTLEVHSLPVVVMTNVSQKSNASATILWDNFFVDHISAGNEIPQKVPWSQFKKMLNYIFTKDIHVPLKDEHFEYFALKIFGKPVADPNTESITWEQFSKKKMENKDFTFWDWFFAIINLIKTYFLKLYQENLVMGFVEKNKSKAMLLDVPINAFLLRFSDHSLGGITVAEKVKGQLKVNNHEPLTCKELKLRPLADTMVKFAIKHCSYLYPDTPAKEAFQKYAEKKQEIHESLDKNGYVKHEVVVVFKSSQALGNTDDSSYSFPESMECLPDNFLGEDNRSLS